MEFITNAGLSDAGFLGSRFTWTTMRIWKRLDRVLISSNWADFFNSFKVDHLHRGSSDHCPLLISAPFLPKPIGDFRFQNMWCLHSGFLQTVRLNWNIPCEGRGLGRLIYKLKRLKNHLKWWNRDVFGNIHDKLKALDLIAAQAELEFDVIQPDDKKEALYLAKAILALGLAMEEYFWKQKAAAKWTVDGEKNTALIMI
ncbi:uncharacterized protein [Henckelia pumila]|uniref:uncharacterized protein n=1 Tax=Henckelia pumila TaxID=405737 RepID=UPI003C6E8E03